MARDAGFEELLRDELANVPGISEKPMFGGVAWMLKGHLLCAARDDGILVRLGKNRDGWALALPDIAPMMMRGRSMSGWVRAKPEAFGDGAVLHALVEAAVRFVQSLPEKGRRDG